MRKRIRLTKNNKTKIRRLLATKIDKRTEEMNEDGHNEKSKANL